MLRVLGACHGASANRGDAEDEVHPEAKALLVRTARTFEVGEIVVERMRFGDGELD